MGVGSADLLTRMMEEERVHAEAYLKELTQMMKDHNVKRFRLNTVKAASCECFFSRNFKNVLKILLALLTEVYR